MARQVFKILLGFMSLLFFARCAQVVPLTGGKRDATPPKLISALPSAKTTHFDKELIVLVFDEYVKTKDLTNQFTISPKLKTSPDIQAGGKSILITLKKEELAPNTTYRLAFGSSIVDMNEGNPIRNFEYVFSTGDFIDSLKIKGTVKDAFTDKPLSSILAALYTTTETETDSLPYLQTPDYTSKSNDNGEFSFSSMPYKKFKGYAFEDKNKNGLYDAEAEKVAFLDQDLELTSDTSIHFLLFQEEASKSFIKKTVLPYAGLAQIFLNKKQHVKLSTLHPSDSASIFETRPGLEKDTLSIYYKNITDTLGLILAFSKKTDTLKITLPNKPVSRRKFKNYVLNASGGLLSLHTLPIITFSNWMNIQETQTTEMRLFSREDSLINLEPVKGRWLDINRFEVTNALKEGVNYKLKIDTCVFLDVNDLCNDSNSITFKTESKAEFGKATLKVRFNKKQPYILQLLNDKNEVAREAFVSFSLSASNAVAIDFSDVKPGTYLVKIIFDDNDNHKWDTGKLFSKKQPEHVIIASKQIKILSDWEIEEDISVKE